MRRNLGSFATLTVAAPLWLALSGCGGMSNETASPPTASGSADGDSAAKAPLNSPEAEKEAALKKASEVPAHLVTPDRAVDPKKLVDVVEQEVKGGESAAPSPESILWLPAKAENVQD